MIGDKDDFQTEEEMFKALENLNERMIKIEDKLIKENENI